MPRLASTWCLLTLLLLTLNGCAVYKWVGIKFLYDEAELPAAQEIEDLRYKTDSALEKHRLDLFLPDSTVVGWPTVVFIHGGGWVEGDKDLSVGGADVYGNIGRFFARRGIGAATINYRLLPKVEWPVQIADVAEAVAWVQAHIADYGGRPDALFLMGHSAGAQLATRVALDETPLRDAGGDPSAICGVIPVSGAALDLVDERTYELDDDPGYYPRRFGTVPDWKKAASPVSFIRPDAPPFLIIYAEGEGPSFHRQSNLLKTALEEAGVSTRLVIVPGESHERIVLALSRDDKTAGPAMLEFVRSLECK